LFFSLNKFNSIIKAQKDPLPADCKKNIAYKISCNDYDTSYVGQTCRQLKTRISEHKNDINRNKTNPLVVMNHRTRHNHDFDWNNVQILDTET